MPPASSHLAEMPVPADQSPFVLRETAGAQVAVAQPAADDLRRLDARLHCQQHARGENRIQERARVSGQDKSIAGMPGVEI